VHFGSRQWSDLRLSPEKLLLGVVLMVVTGVVTGLVPALRAGWLPIVDALRET
jgi:ABC-type lipoprotein release transport system permease subunit